MLHMLACAKACKKAAEFFDRKGMPYNATVCKECAIVCEMVAKMDRVGHATCTKEVMKLLKYVAKACLKACKNHAKESPSCKHCAEVCAQCLEMASGKMMKGGECVDTNRDDAIQNIADAQKRIKLNEETIQTYRDLIATYQKTIDNSPCTQNAASKVPEPEPEPEPEPKPEPKPSISGVAARAWALKTGLPPPETRGGKRKTAKHA